MEHDIAVVLTTAPNEDEARALARLLVEQQLAACVQLLPIHSVYQWEGAIQQEPEVLLLAKTRRSRYAEVEACIRSHHSYTVPEILQLPVEQGLPAYLAWLGGHVPPAPATLPGVNGRSDQSV